jgi:hypothetical protein
MRDLKRVEESPSFTEGEKQWARCLCKTTGSFYAALFECVCRADPENRERLALGFPEFVAAGISWMEGDLAIRYTAFGLKWD